MAIRGERARKRAEWALMVGRAFRCGDGLIRWITDLSTRDYFALLWLEESRGVWYSGGIVKADKWEGGEEVPAPQPGDRYQLGGATGMVNERTVPRREGAGGEEGRQGGV